jgi:hypothetical protein
MSPNCRHSRNRFCFNYFGTVLGITWLEFWTERLKSRFEENIELCVDVVRNLGEQFREHSFMYLLLSMKPINTLQIRIHATSREMIQIESIPLESLLTGIAATNVYNRNRTEVGIVRSRTKATELLLLLLLSYFIVLLYLHCAVSIIGLVAVD